MITTNYLPGAPIWVDLATRDVAAAADFYRAVLGWQLTTMDTETAGFDAGGYGMFTLDGKTVAAVGPAMSPEAPSAWTIYFATHDIAATADAAKQAGGQVRFGPHPVHDRGVMCGLTDSTGADFALWQPGKTKGLDTVTEPGSLCWAELYTPDAEEAKSFYATVLGWSIEDVPMDVGGTYSVATPAEGGPGGGHGGIVQITSEMGIAGIAPRWQPYFEVTNCDVVAAAATSAGGTLFMAPTDMAGVGRIAMIEDPFGAPVAVITSATPES